MLLLRQVVTVAGCVGWMGVSSALIMVNKYLMSTDGFHYPMALSCLGMLFSSVASWFACRVRAPWLLARPARPGPGMTAASSKGVFFLQKKSALLSRSIWPS